MSMTSYDWTHVVWQHGGKASTIEGAEGVKILADIRLLPARPFVDLWGVAVDVEIIGHTPEGYPVGDVGPEILCLL